MQTKDVIGHKRGLDLKKRFQSTRALTERLAAALSPEDQTVQSMPDASPCKWHLAHTTWFFETLVLHPCLKDYRAFNPAYEYLFNSYYQALGSPYPRPERGMITRPSVKEILDYRHQVTKAILLMLDRGSSDYDSGIEVGIQHEQQHQELLLMDAKHLLSLNPLQPAYQNSLNLPLGSVPPLRWLDFPGGLLELGYGGPDFSFDNERPRHRAWLDPFKLAARLVTCGEFAAFIDANGYQRPELWLAAGWDCVNQNGWQAPLYWKYENKEWSVFTLSGLRAMNPHEPVCHVSAYEAAAFAKWAGKRLPRESEWEIAASSIALKGNTLESGLLHPAPTLAEGLQQMIGDVWEWTASPYIGYPGFTETDGLLREYNGKFMSNQMVLRGGCTITPIDHIRITYRNFFPPDARWMFGGIRLAEDLR